MQTRLFWLFGLSFCVSDESSLLRKRSWSVKRVKHYDRCSLPLSASFVLIGAKDLMYGINCNVRYSDTIHHGQAMIKLCTKFLYCFDIHRYPLLYKPNDVFKRIYERKFSDLSVQHILSPYKF